MDNITTVPAHEYDLTTLSDVINRAFKDYVGGVVQLTAQSLAASLNAWNVGLNLSLLLVEKNAPVGIALIARRGAASRVALMGIVNEHQGRGLGKILMKALIADARSRLDQSLTLEVIEQNPRAVKLYRALGFTTIRRLTGYKGTGLQGTPQKLTRVDVTAAARQIMIDAVPDLPWPCSPETMLKLGPPNVTYKSAGCYAIISNPDAPTIVIRGLAVPRRKQRTGMATQLASALIAAHPGKNWHIPAICPEEYGGVFLKNGFEPDTISQFQMILPL